MKMQKSTIATSLAVLLSSVGLNALDITNSKDIVETTNPTLSEVDGEKVGLNINFSQGGGE